MPKTFSCGYAWIFECKVHTDLQTFSTIPPFCQGLGFCHRPLPSDANTLTSLKNLPWHTVFSSEFGEQPFQGPVEGIKAGAQGPNTCCETQKAVQVCLSPHCGGDWWKWCHPVDGGKKQDVGGSAKHVWTPWH